MTLIRWQPIAEFETARRQLDRLLDDFAPNYDAFLKRVESNWTPAIELEVKPEAFILRVQLPGIDPKTVDIQVSREEVSIVGESKLEQKSEENSYVRSEFRYGKFHRVVSLPAAVQNEQVKADYTDGILTLILPREQAVRPTVVKVNLTEPQVTETTN